MKGFSARFFGHVPSEELVRYLMVGTWNTVFGYCSFALFVALLDPLIPHGYIVAMVVSSLVNITISFLGYKLFVFRTKGRYLREWLRCLAVYSGGMRLELLRCPWSWRHFATVLGCIVLRRISEAPSYGIWGCLQLLRPQESFLPKLKNEQAHKLRLHLNGPVLGSIPSFSAVKWIEHLTVLGHWYFRTTRIGELFVAAGAPSHYRMESSRVCNEDDRFASLSHTTVERWHRSAAWAPISCS